MNVSEQLHYCSCLLAVVGSACAVALCCIFLTLCCLLLLCSHYRCGGEAFGLLHKPWKDPFLLLGHCWAGKVWRAA